MIELMPLQSGGGGILWIVVGLIMAFWVYKIETGGSSSGDSRTQRNPPRSHNPSQQKTGPSSTESTSVNNTPESESIYDDRDVGVDREPYSERLERPDFNFDDTESRTPTAGTDDPPSLGNLPDKDELPNPDDIDPDQ